MHRQCPRIIRQPVLFKVATKSLSGSKKSHIFSVSGLWFADLLKKEALALSSTWNAAATLSALARAANISVQLNHQEALSEADLQVTGFSELQTLVSLGKDQVFWTSKPHRSGKTGQLNN